MFHLLLHKHFTGSFSPSGATTGIALTRPATVTPDVFHVAQRERSTSTLAAIHRELLNTEENVDGLTRTDDEDEKQHLFLYQKY